MKIIQFLKSLLKEGRLKIEGGSYKGKKITYHDPCYLGRANNEYEAPRDLINKLESFSELKRIREKAIFIAIFFVPMVLTLITGVVGYARIYVYWLPFVLFLSAYGMTETISWLKKQTGSLVYGLEVGVVFLLMFFPAKQITKYYEDRGNGFLVVAGPNATLSEATKMAVWTDENIPENNLVVISVGVPESRVLTKYMKK